MNWFSYDPEDGIEFHKTEAEARERAEHVLDMERDNSVDGWSELVEQICYGKVVGGAVETERRAAREDDCIPGCEEYVDYQILENK